MKFFKKGSAILIAGIMLFSCTACSGLDKLADGLKSGVEQVGSNVAIGKSNALITPYQSFDGKHTSDNTAFGNSIIPFRFNNRPEIVLVELNAR